MKVKMATHEGELKIGDVVYPVAVLDDGSRVITRSGIMDLLDRPYKGQYVGELPAFVQAANLQPYISDYLRGLLEMVEYKTCRGQSAKGIPAEALPEICGAYIDANRAGVLNPSQAKTAVKCEMIIRALAKTGIVALIDEATGYQEVRDRRALQAILDKYLLGEFAAWAKRFPTEFYQEIFRLKGWKWVGMNVNRPQIVGQITNDVVYERLAPGIKKELQARNPKDEAGNRKVRHHQYLTPDIGHPALTQHLHAVIAFMRASSSWRSFYQNLQRAFPKKGDQLTFDLEE